MTPSNPVPHTSTRGSPAQPWQSGDPYERYMGRWSRQLAPRFLQTLSAPSGLRWLDVGCGTGALSAAILAQASPLALTGIDPSEGFLATARQRLGERITLHRASAAALPLADSAVDITVSALMLNFVPDPVAALREMARVTVQGGTVALYVWDYAGKMDLIRRYWDAAAQLDPQAQSQHQAQAPSQHQGERFPICHPEALAAALTVARLGQVEVSVLEIEMHFVDFDDYWAPFLGGQGPAPAHAMSLDEDQRERLRRLLQLSLPTRPDGTIALAARAWVARGIVAR